MNEAVRDGRKIGDVGENATYGKQKPGRKGQIQAYF